MSLEVYSINGPVVTILGETPLSMMEMVYVGAARLVGEVIAVSTEKTTIQVYENTAGLRPGEPVEPTGGPMQILLGPGVMREIFDGIARPLRRLEAESGAFIATGLNVPAIDTEKRWKIKPVAALNEKVTPGQVVALCQETPAVENRITVPDGVSGTVVSVLPEGEYTVLEPLLVVRDADGVEHGVTAAQKWPIRRPRPVAARLPVSEPMQTGRRVIDTLFPIARGGAAAIPGGFGTGKTMVQHTLAKYSDADIIVYVGCGERGNEMTQVLTEFSALTDPRTGQSMLDRTVLIANTSNMPVAAREASIYTGVTIAEYYRDMGYHVAMMADSSSRWAEALREISGRLEEMPAEEGYPAYLPSRLSAFYERAGAVTTRGGAEGSVTLIAAVSPQGNDFSEPVTQNTKRFTRCFWALDKSLAYARHYPAINWSESYSEYADDLRDWYETHVDRRFFEARRRISELLGAEAELMEIVKLIGADLLADDQKLTLEAARAVRVGFLQQDALHPVDCTVPLAKQYRMMRLILDVFDRARRTVGQRIPISRLTALGIFDRLCRIKFEIGNEDTDAFDRVRDEIFARIDALEGEYKA